MTEANMFRTLTMASMLAFTLGLIIAVVKDRKTRNEVAILVGLLPIISFVLCLMKAAPKDGLNPFGLVGLIYWLPISFVTLFPAFGVGWAMAYLGQTLCACRRQEISLKGMRRYGPPPVKWIDKPKRRSLRPQPVYDPRWMPTDSEN